VTNCVTNRRTDRRSVWPACDRFTEDRVLGSSLVDVERLWVELLGKFDDFVFGHRVSADLVSVADREILKIQRHFPGVGRFPIGCLAYGQHGRANVSSNVA